MEKPMSDSMKGLALIACSMVLLPASLELMQDQDDVEREYETECDLQYRSLTGNYSTPDADLCSELNDERSTKATMFMLSLAAFVVTGLVGLVLLLPGEDADV